MSDRIREALERVVKESDDLAKSFGLDRIYEEPGSAIEQARAALSTPPAQAEIGEEAEAFSWAVDYGKDLLKDINRMAHTAGTNAIQRDILQRAYVEISRLRASNAGEGAAVAALKTCLCPRPANAAPGGITVEQCMARDECGCDCGAAITKATNALR